MMLKKEARNCWEVKKCPHAHQGGCPAYPNHGVTCYMVTGTLCAGSTQGAYTDKIKRCRACDFYAQTIAVGSGEAAA